MKLCIEWRDTPERGRVAEIKRFTDVVKNFSNALSQEHSKYFTAGKIVMYKKIVRSFRTICPGGDLPEWLKREAPPVLL